MPAKIRIRSSGAALAVITALCLALAPLTLTSPALAGEQALSPAEARERIAADGDLLILDVRGPEERRNGFYAGSINIPVQELKQRAAEVPGGRPVLIHCARGVRAKRAHAILRELRPDLPELLYIAGPPLFEAVKPAPGRNSAPAHAP